MPSRCHSTVSWRAEATRVFDAGLNQSQSSFQARAHDAAAADQRLLDARVVRCHSRPRNRRAARLTSFSAPPRARSLPRAHRAVHRFNRNFCSGRVLQQHEAKAEEQRFRKSKKELQAADADAGGAT
jgi:hypothetical protein